MASSRSIAQHQQQQQNGGGDMLNVNTASPAKPLTEKQHRRKGAEKSVLDDIMGDPDDFGDIGVESDADSDGAGHWEDNIRESMQDASGAEEVLHDVLKQEGALVEPGQKEDAEQSTSAINDNNLPSSLEDDHVQPHSGPKEAIQTLESSSFNGIAQSLPQRYRYFIIKSLNYHNIQKSIQRGIWATQAMNEPILNEAFMTADKVILIFSVNMSGHFQGYAQMVSPIGRRKANVWSEASWGGTFNVEWIQLYDLPFQRTLHLKNPLNSFKPVKISRDCQELTEEIGEALCSLIDEGAASEGNSKRKVNLNGTYFMKKPCLERLPQGEKGFYRPQSKGQMAPFMFPANMAPPLPLDSQYPLMVERSSSKIQGSSRLNSPVPLLWSKGLNEREERPSDAFRSNVTEAPYDEDLLNMSYEEYLQVHGNSKDYRPKQAIAPQPDPSKGKNNVDVNPDDEYANYLANWYATKQATMVSNGCYLPGQLVASSMYPANSQTQ